VVITCTACRIPEDDARAYGGWANDQAPFAATIAIVDDDESVRESIAGLVEAVGYQVASFGSAEELLDGIGNLESPACLVLDVRLPGISGIELHAELTRRGWSVPVIFVTAHPDLAVKTKAGAVAVLYKPFPPQDLLRAVRKAIREVS
jgi:FixJ family two-component response regulator